MLFCLSTHELLLLSLNEFYEFVGKKKERKKKSFQLKFVEICYIKMHYLMKIIYKFICKWWN